MSNINEKNHELGEYIPEFSRPVDILNMGSIGKHYKFQATDEENKALTERFSVVSFDNLSAKCHIKPIKKGKYKLEATFKGDVVQLCVVSLDPIEETISGKFTILLLQKSNQKNPENTEITFDPDEDDIEYLTSNICDIGELIVQHLFLEINPYPKKEDITRKELGQEILQEDNSILAGEKENPFGVLKSLKHKT